MHLDRQKTSLELWRRGVSIMITCQRATVQHLRRSPGVIALAGRDFALMLPAKPSALVLQETDSVFWIVAWEIYSPALLKTNIHLSRAIAFLFSSAACSARNNFTSPSLSFSLSLACMGNSIYESVFSLLLSLCAGKDSELRVHIFTEKEMKEVFYHFCVWYKSKGSFACDNTQSLRLWSVVRV